MTLVTVCSGTVYIATRPAAGDAISSAKAQAAAIESTLAAAQAQMSALGQQYDAAAARLQQINSHIAATKAVISADHKQVAGDRSTLSKAAVANYVSDGSASSEDPIFSSNEKTIGAAAEYNQIAEGDINLAVANLHTAVNSLSVQQTQLQNQQGQAQKELVLEQAAVAQNAREVQAQTNALAQENGQIAALVQEQQNQEAAAAEQAATAELASAQQQGAAFAGVNDAAPPPTAPGGAGAVQAAEGQIGVPYVWGGASPKGSADPGFDCSGLVMWSWAQVGVDLPHYSGSQMSDSTPVPLSDLQPGDLLFYGPGGSQHVAMYIGGDQMIEAPHTGAYVWITGIRLGGDFAGAGRP